MADTTQLYQWTGINKQGKRVKGVTQAAESKDVPAELKKIGVEVVSFKQKHQFYKGSAQRTSTKLKMKDILLFTRFLSTLIAAGLPILPAIDVIAHDQENEAMSKLLQSVRSNIAEGKTLSEAFSEYPENFNELYCNLIRTGEKSGTLDKILIRIGAYLEKSEILKSKIKKALVYPIAIITVALLVSSILLIFVVPQFQTMFKSFGAQLPLFTRMIISLSEFMQAYWWVIALIIGFGIWGFRRALRKYKSVRTGMDHFMLRLIIVGPIFKKGIIARFTRTLATTLDSGMPITDALKSMANIMGNSIYCDAMNQIRENVISGHALNVSMSATKLFPNMVIQMISVGEASGALGQMLNKIADYYEEEVANIVDNLSSLLEPLIMLILGVLIGGLVIAMYLPIFKLGTLV
jgi:type IV pilus assembly protein PilC